jgi:hypothetical protein
MNYTILPCLALLVCAVSNAKAANVMLLIGNSNGTVGKGGFSIGDRFIHDRLQTVLKHTVTVIPDSASKDSILHSAARADLVIVMESTTSLLLGSKLKTTPTPLLNYEAFIQDEMGMTALTPPGDPGMPDKFALGVQLSGDAIAIQKPDHPLAAGLTGRVKIYSQPKSITWGKVAATAEVIATLAGDTADASTGATIYLYAKGVRLFDGTTAAGMRIGFFLEDDNVTGTPNLMTAEGLALFDRAVEYGLANGVVALHPPVSPVAKAAGIASGHDGTKTAGRSAMIRIQGYRCDGRAGL